MTGRLIRFRRGPSSALSALYGLGLALASIVGAPGCDDNKAAGGVCGDGVCGGSETPGNCPRDCGVCNDDGICGADESPQSCPNDCPCVLDGYCDSAGGETVANCLDDCGCVVDGLCDPVTGETEATCPQDCAATCDLQSITPAGAPMNYIISNFRMPTSTFEAQSIGVDLDGDNIVDNKLGQILSLFAGQGVDPNSYVNDSLLTGELVILGRIYIDQFPDDPVILTQVFEGEIPGGTPPRFDGNDVVTIRAGFPTTDYLCGEAIFSQMRVGPGNLAIPFPLPGNTEFITVRQVRMQGDISDQGWTNVMMGGGLTRDDIVTQVVPSLTNYLNALISEDATGPTAQQILGFFDQACDSSIDGCETTRNGEGDCLLSDPTVDPAPWITETEVRCNNLFDSAAEPDVDINNDGVADLLSLGIRVRAVRATFQ